MVASVISSQDSFSHAPTDAPADARFIGIDVAKASLEVFGQPGMSAVPNTPAAIRALCRQLVKASTDQAPVAIIALEATGGYERTLVHALLDAGLPVVRLNPLRVRRFAQSRGLLAKTDRLDAELIADYARCNATVLLPLQPISETAAMLKELVAQRTTVGPPAGAAGGGH